MAPISPCQSGRRVITGDSTAHLSSFLTPVCVHFRVPVWVATGADVDIAPSPQWASGLLPLLHSSLLITVWPPPCHSPGVQKVMMSVSSQGCPQGSWSAAAVSRNPSGLVLRWSHRQIRTQVLCYVWAYMCIFPLCVCNHVIYQTWMTKLVNVTGETISFTSHWNQVQTRQCTQTHLEDKKAHFPCFTPLNLTSTHAVLNSLRGASSFTAKSICVTLLNLSVGSGGCIAE